MRSNPWMPLFEILTGPAPCPTSPAPSRASPVLPLSPPGDIDPAIIPFLASKGMAVGEIDSLMNKQSGFLGLAGAPGQGAAQHAAQHSAAHSKP